MSALNHVPDTHRTRGVKKVGGRFKPNGVGAIDNLAAGAGGTLVGRGFTVARTGVGLYAITTPRPYGACLHIDCMLWSSTITGGGVFRVTSQVLGPTTTVTTIQHYAESAGALAAADIAAAADNFVSFNIWFADARVQRA